jgi:hypothetical protein
MAQSITLRQIKEAALDNLGLILYGNADSVDLDNHSVRSFDIVNKSPDRYGIEQAFLVSREASATGNTWSRILSLSVPETPDTMVLHGGPFDLDDGDPFAVYLLLNPDEVKACVNEALSEMWKRVNVPFSFVQNQTDYPVDDMDDPEGGDCSWVTTRGQIETVKVKMTLSNGYMQEAEWAGYSPVESNNSVTLHFSYLPGHQENLTGVLVANKPYVYPGARLEEDGDTTNCPFRLAQLGSAVKILRLCYKKYGTEVVRVRFGSTLALLEQEWAAAKIQYMPPLRASSYLIEETFEQDIPWSMRSPSW